MSRGIRIGATFPASRPHLTPEVKRDSDLFNQINGALYHDDCTWVVPGSHLRDDLPAEREAIPDDVPRPPQLDDKTSEERERICLDYCRSMPGARRLYLDPGDLCIYRNTLWHTANSCRTETPPSSTSSTRPPTRVARELRTVTGDEEGTTRRAAATFSLPNAGQRPDADRRHGHGIKPGPAGRAPAAAAAAGSCALPVHLHDLSARLVDRDGRRLDAQQCDKATG